MAKAFFHPSTHRRLKQEDSQEFKDNLGYIISSTPDHICYKERLAQEGERVGKGARGSSSADKSACLAS